MAATPGGSDRIALTATYALHDSLTGAVGAFSPGKRANGTAF